ECAVFWLAAPGELLSVSITTMPPTTDPEETALRIARSVVADPAAVCEVSVEFGWLPPGYGDAQRSFQLGASVKPGQPVTAATRVEGMFLSPAAPGRMADLTVGVDRPRPAEAQDITVRGRPGWLVWNEQGQSVVRVPVEDGRPLVLTVYAAETGRRPAGTLPLRGNRGWTRDELLRVVDAFRLGPVPDLSWIGRR
ncbi:MAG TPA: hypothetical protein VFR67_03885, partial [Pilimelia sp.]|nr:hypothetical protein [Pilimelia sp.]